MKNYPYYDQVKEMDSLAALISEKAGRQPDDTAYSWMQNRQLVTRTFKDFEQDVLTMHEWLHQNHLLKKRTALLLPNSYAWIVLFDAIVIGGGVAAAMNPALPAAEIEGMLVDADMEVVITTRALAGKLAALSSLQEKQIEIFDIQDVESVWHRIEPRNAARDLLELPAYSINKVAAIFFTSGTTGKPKAAMLTQKNILADMSASAALYKPGGSTVSLLPFYHAFGFVTGILMPFAYGVETFISTSLRRMMADLQRQSPSIVFMVPLMVETIHKRIWKSIEKSGRTDKVRKGMKLAEALLKVGIDIRPRLFNEILKPLGGQLEHVICGGAFLDDRYVRDFHAWGVQILIGYGITECSPVASVNRNNFQKKNSAGHLVKGLQARTNEKGEILFKGDIVFAGYYNDPQATEAIFEDGWLNTGDLGSVDKDGFLFLTGRSKNLIILANGENISPEQIEMDLQNEKAVEEIVVYEEDGKIAAEIYPAEQWQDNPGYFDELIATWNHERPVDHQIARIHLRQEPFVKNASQKIVRSKA